MIGNSRCIFAVAIISLMLGVSNANWAAAASAIDANLYTTYQMDSNKTSISWVTCGATALTSGCYDSGTMSSFAKACAVMEGEPEYRGDVATRLLFVLDIGPTAASKVILHVFRKTDSITSTYDTTAIEQFKSVDLPLTAGNKAACFMAGNGVAIFAGTSASTTAAEIWKSNWVAGSIGGFSTPLFVSSITADNRGYVSVSFGEPSSSVGGFYAFGPSGYGVEDGGAVSNILFFNKTNAVLAN